MRVWVVGVFLAVVAAGGVGSPVDAKPDAQVVPPVRSVVVACVSKASSTLRVSADSSCRYGSEFKLVWSVRGAAPALCINTNNREMTLAYVGQCPFKGIRLARPTSTREILACADKDTGVLRWPRTGKCWWENTSVKWLAAPVSDGASSTTTTSSTTSSSTTTSSTTTTSTTVVTPSVTTTVAPSNNSGSSDTTTTTTTTLPTAPAFTLSSSSETKAQNVAIAGYTISSTGGTIASYAISPAQPAGLTFNASTGLLSGTPTTVQGATAYTITATNATGTATATFTLTVTAATYAVGATGPGGGIVFYVSATNFTSTGSDCNTACKYLEAATSDLANSNWCSNTATLLNVTATGIGSGMSNTTTADVTCSSGAIQAAADYTNNGKIDWHLPSKDELNELYTNKTTVGGFSSAYYWSSSELGANYAWTQSFYDGFQSNLTKNSTLFVRPVRAFG